MSARWSASTQEALALLDDASFRVASGGVACHRNHGLASYCTYRVGGPAAALVEVSSVRVLEAIREVVSATGVPTLVVGRGSNLLVSDSGVDGLVLHLTGDFDEILIDPPSDEGGKGRVRAGAAALLPVVARRSAAAGLTGFEWAVGVPGSIGGGVFMNAGGHGSDMASSLVRASVFDLYDGGPDEWAVLDLDFGYRQSALAASHVVLWCELLLEPGSVEASQQMISEIVAWRRSNQPGGQNAGSVFTNPADDSAGRLIDAAGLKGHRIGTAEISVKHANFIQVDPEGSAADVVALIRYAQSRIVEMFDVELRPENRLVGFPDVVRGEP